MSRPKHHFIFIAYTALFAVAALYHVVGIFIPEATISVPRWRHGVFVLINIVLIIHTLKRTKWSLIIIGLITLQQMYSHGFRAMNWYTNDHRIDWISLVIIALLPLLNVLLFNHLKDRHNAFN